MVLAATMWLAASLALSKMAAAANAVQIAVCDPAADHFLSIANYPETIRLHRALLKRQPQNSLASYHLGFAYGMLGDQADEIQAYRRAIALGLPARTNLAILNATHALAAPPRERPPVDIAPIRDARALHSSTTGMSN